MVELGVKLRALKELKKRILLAPSRLRVETCAT